MHNRSVPTSTMLAHLCYRDLAEACDWLTRVFGFTEYYRYGQPVSGVQMYLGDAHIMLVGPSEGRRETPAELGCGTQMLTIFVPDVRAHYANTKRHRRNDLGRASRNRLRRITVRRHGPRWPSLALFATCARRCPRVLGRNGALASTHASDSRTSGNLSTHL